jgi:hypothetical protein
VRRPLWTALVIVPSLVLTARCARAEERSVRSTSTSSTGGTAMSARAAGALGVDVAAPPASAGVASSTTAPASLAPAVSVRGRALLDPSATTSRLDEVALGRARAEGTTLAELVDRLPGARVLDDGGPLQARRLTVRGGTPAQAQVVVDGLPLAAPFSTGLDVGILGTEAIARATLVRGGRARCWATAPSAARCGSRPRRPVSRRPGVAGARRDAGAARAGGVGGAARGGVERRGRSQRRSLPVCLASGGAARRGPRPREQRRVLGQGLGAQLGRARRRATRAAGRRRRARGGVCLASRPRPI